MRSLLFVIPCLALVACGDDGGSTPPIDAPGGAAATRVECATVTPTVTVTAPGFAFEPENATIAVGQVVAFDMPATHSAVSDTAGLFNATFNTTTCYRFDRAGTYPYHCDPHQFPGTIVVQ